MVDSYARAAQAAASFLVSEQQPDGSIGPDISASYKSLWPLATAGRLAEATKFLDSLVSSFYRPGQGFGMTNPAAAYAPAQLQWRFLYSNAWLTVGSHLLGRFEVSYPTLEFILRYQTPDGGFFADRDQTGEDGPQDMLSAAMCGLTCLYLGEFDAAKKAAAFLHFLVESQPEPEERIYLNGSPRGRLLTEFPAEKSYDYIIDKRQPRQPYFAPGGAAAFLSKLYGITKDGSYLETAKRAYAMALSPQQDMPEGMFDYPTSGKIGWGTAMIYQATGETEYRQAAERVVSYLLRTQLPNGAWPEFRNNSDANLGAEFCIWLAEIDKALS